MYWFLCYCLSFRAVQSDFTVDCFRECLTLILENKIFYDQTIFRLRQLIGHLSNMEFDRYGRFTEFSVVSS